MSTTVYVGLAVTSHLPLVPAVATFSQVSFGASRRSPTLPAPWTSGDVGSPGLAGSGQRERRHVYPEGRRRGRLGLHGPVPVRVSAGDRRHANRRLRVEPAGGGHLVQGWRHDSQRPVDLVSHAFMFASGIERLGLPAPAVGWRPDAPQRRQLEHVLLAGCGSSAKAICSAPTARPTAAPGCWSTATPLRCRQRSTSASPSRATTPAALATAAFGSVAISAPTSTNKPPTVSIATPGSGASFTAPAGIPITANAADVDGLVTRVDFYVGATLIGSDTTSPFSTTWGSVPAGNYSLTAVATDNAGASTTSAAVGISVVSAPRPRSRPGWCSWPRPTTQPTSARSRCSCAAPGTRPPRRQSPASALASQRSPAARISVDISALVNPLPAGSYYAVVVTVGPGGIDAQQPLRRVRRSKAPHVAPLGSVTPLRVLPHRLHTDELTAPLGRSVVLLRQSRATNPTPQLIYKNRPKTRTLQLIRSGMRCAETAEVSAVASGTAFVPSKERACLLGVVSVEVRRSPHRSDCSRRFGVPRSITVPAAGRADRPPSIIGSPAPSERALPWPWAARRHRRSGARRRRDARWQHLQGERRRLSISGTNPISSTSSINRSAATPRSSPGS